jgi:hypothetical protein
MAKSGAKPGNRNALKHGLYSEFIIFSEIAGLKDMSDKTITDEIAMARVNFKNAMQQANQAGDSKAKLSWDFASHYWMETIINAILRSKEQEQTAAVVWDTFIAAIRAANDRQQVRR